MAKTYDDEHMAPHGDSCMMSEHMLGLPKFSLVVRSTASR